MSVVPAGFTRLDNDTDVATLLSLPNALAQPYLFLLTRARLSRPGAHWGEVAAAINRSQTQTHVALRGLKELGLAEESNGSWLAIRRKPTGQPAETLGEVERESPGNTPEVQTETHRKPAMNKPGKNVQHSETVDPKEGTEGKKEVKEKNTPLTPQGVNGPGRQEKTELDNTLAADLRPAQDSPTAPQEPSLAKGLEEVPRRAAPPALPDDLAAVPGMPAAWGRWQKHAREIRLQLKESTAEAQFRKLRTLLDEGKDLPQHIDHAIESGWRSFFPIRQHAASPAPPVPDQDFTPRRSYE